MNIHFHCPFCGKSVRVEKQYAGRRGKCPKCEKVVQIPSDDQTAAAMQSNTASSENDSCLPQEIFCFKTTSDWVGPVDISPDGSLVLGCTGDQFIGSGQLCRFVHADQPDARPRDPYRSKPTGQSIQHLVALDPDSQSGYADLVRELTAAYDSWEADVNSGFTRR